MKSLIEANVKMVKLAKKFQKPTKKIVYKVYAILVYSLIKMYQLIMSNPYVVLVVLVLLLLLSLI